jgi:AraC-like DNA-binding protein
MNLNVLQLITLFSSFLLFLLGSIFLFYPHGKKLNNSLLGAFMFSNAVLLGNFFCALTIHNYWLHFPLINDIGHHSYLLLAPLLYLYIIALCSSDYRFSLKSILHFLPYIIVVCLAFLIDIFAKELELFIPKTGYYFDLIYKTILYTQIAAYIIASFLVLGKYRSQLKELYSSLIKFDLLWIKLILYSLILMWFTDVLIFFEYTLHLFNSYVSQYLIYQTISINLILCICLIYKGMRQTPILSGVLAVPKYGQNLEELTNYQAYRKQLDFIMEKEKPYLSPELNLEELAKRLNITPKQLSQTIHVCFNQNFNNYINWHRVEEAKRLMETDKMNKKILYEILFEAGFNSKSVFNESFKKFTEFTPKEFRKKMTNITS